MSDTSEQLKKAKLVAMRRAVKLASVFMTKEGEIALDMLEKESGYREAGYTKGDPYDTIYRAGKRDMVVFIHEMIKATKKGIDEADVV